MRRSAGAHAGAAAMRARVAVAAAMAARALLAIAVLAACRGKPTAGTACRVPDRLVCGGGAGALACDTGTWVEVPCLGAHGCLHRTESDDCDDTIGADGDRCPRNPPLDYACTADRKSALVCKEGRFTLWRACRGPDGCQIQGGRGVRCDTSLGEAGDPCEQPGTFACSADRQAILACDGRALQAASSCRGPGGCGVRDGSRKLDCDDTLVLEGDPCNQPKRIACAVDHRSELVCDGGRYVKRRDCRRSDCRLDGDELFCD